VLAPPQPSLLPRCSRRSSHPTVGSSCLTSAAHPTIGVARCRHDVQSTVVEIARQCIADASWWAADGELNLLSSCVPAREEMDPRVEGKDVPCNEHRCFLYRWNGHRADILPRLVGYMDDPELSQPGCSAEWVNTRWTWWRTGKNMKPRILLIIRAPKVGRNRIITADWIEVNDKIGFWVVLHSSTCQGWMRTSPIMNNFIMGHSNDLVHY
jgi:hypothetical protein